LASNSAIKKDSSLWFSASTKPRPQERVNERKLPVL
jgi:hypothetical protein